ncbi:hypothetical protein KGF54_002114 [Candida jiufengensis]|uniref:uncharacterized protein n=1 Tax=Candida jiufengensis TaxID=497108 RepID=UPI0022255AEB|nr:uncharacterized protein KGF54_002114 [Candida jiufengensis]KAI5954339.1 hypothetical protein KGF54_002114 [Candida jiufengensis]
MSLSKVPKQKGILHTFGFNLTAFEFTDNPDEVSENIIIFIGGLQNGLLNVPYLPQLAKSVSKVKGKDKESWSLIQILLSSAYTGYGITSLSKDSQ